MSGLVYLRARFYHPVLGRFLQWDSFAGFQQRPQSLNRYSYTENNPVNHRDPSGHFIDTLLDVGFLAYDVYRLVQDNVLHNCDNLNENVFALMLDVGGLLLPGLTGLGHADEVYDLVRYADELPEAGRFADDAAKLLDNGDDVA
ncbi:MAG: RHS repeat-associated core domain-containing protein [Caldilinea sp. CFX5]|nr:RHS repeat-associated core domain-containing protein [Caldilinea sp. CFX5]